MRVGHAMTIADELTKSADKCSDRYASFAYSIFEFSLRATRKWPMQKTIYSRENRLVLKLLKDIRVARGLTQAELAKRTRMLQSDVSKVETGVRRVDFVELRHWLIALDLDMAAFVTEFEARLPEVASVRKM